MHRQGGICISSLTRLFYAAGHVGMNMVDSDGGAEMLSAGVQGSFPGVHMLIKVARSRYIPSMGFDEDNSGDIDLL